MNDDSFRPDDTPDVKPESLKPASRKRRGVRLPGLRRQANKRPDFSSMRDTPTVPDDVPGQVTGGGFFDRLVPWQREEARRQVKEGSAGGALRRQPLPPRPRWLVPTPRRLRAYGNGSIGQGLEWIAMRNPIYRFFLSRLPFGGASRAALAAGCGCATGCGCANGCCAVAGCLWPFAVIFIIVFLIGALLGNSPTFATPLFCEANQVAECGSAGMRLEVQIDDIPPGAIDDYKAVEEATGIPWFYLLAWEKVATDFGTLEALPGGGSVEVPNDAIDATYEVTEALLAVADADVRSEQHNPVSSALPSIEPLPGLPGDATLVEQHRAAKQRLVENLRADLRGGSFGLSLTSIREWQAFGQIEGAGGEESLRDAWGRLDASSMLAEHILEAFPSLADEAEGNLTSYSTELLTPLHETIRDYIVEELGGNLAGDDEPDQPESYYQALIEYHRDAPLATPAPDPDEEQPLTLTLPLQESALIGPFGPSSDPADPPLVLDGVSHEHFHAVQTYAAPLGSAVLAAADGTVTAVEKDDVCGRRCSSIFVVRIAHGSGYETSYLGLGADLPTVGAPVSAGQRIGAIGSPTSGSPFLDFGLRLTGEPVDPASFVVEETPEATPQPEEGDDYGEWLDGPRSGQSYSDSELYLICNQLAGGTAQTPYSYRRRPAATPAPDASGSPAPDLNFGRGGSAPSTTCDDFRLGAPTIDVGSEAEWAATLSRFYDPTLPEGEQVTDWRGLQVLMGAMFERDDFWGSDTSAVFEAPLVDGEGNVTNQTVEMNAYVVAINTYARSAYEAYAAAAALQPEAGIVGGLFDTDGMDMQFWRPAIDEAAAAHNIGWQYLAATLRADLAMTCATTDEKHIWYNPDGSEMTIAQATEAEMVEGADYFLGRDGQLLSTVTPTPVQRCWRFGRGTASQWGDVVTTDGISHAEPVAAMNYCEWGFRHAKGGGDIGNCGTATVTSIETGESITLPVVEYCNCWTGVPTAADSPSVNGEHERMIDLNVSALRALGISGGLNEVTVEIHPPDDPIGWPGFIQRGQFDSLTDPEEIVNGIALALREEIGGSPSEQADMLDMYGAWRFYSSCIVPPGVAPVAVLDPLDPTKTLGQAATCTFVSTASTYAYSYFASGGGVQGTLYGRQPVSAAGYIWPVVGFPMTDGFTPREGGAAYLHWVTPSGRVLGNSHDGLDIGMPCGTAKVLAAKDGVLTGGRGNATLRHDDGLVSFYGHMYGLVPAVQGRMVNGSVRVTRGEVIGISGDVGSPGACHLHYAVYIAGASMGAPGTRGTPNYWAGQEALLSANPAGESGNWLPLRIDPLHVLPQDDSQLMPRGRVGGQVLYLFSIAKQTWYYDYYAANNGYPPPIDANALRSGIVRLTNGVVIGD